jgi:hypothetical protein
MVQGIERSAIWLIPLLCLLAGVAAALLTTAMSPGTHDEDDPAYGLRKLVDIPSGHLHDEAGDPRLVIRTLDRDGYVRLAFDDEADVRTARVSFNNMVAPSCGG